MYCKCMKGLKSNQLNLSIVTKSDSEEARAAQIPLCDISMTYES